MPTLAPPRLDGRSPAPAGQAGPAATQPATAAEQTRAAADQARAAAEQARSAAEQARSAAEQPSPEAGGAAAPGAPPAPPPGADLPAAVFVPGMGLVQPMTLSQVRALQQRSERLSEQLESVEGRRADLVEQLAQTTDPAVRAGLEDRIRFLDQRLLSLEEEIEAASSQRASMAARLGAQTSEPAPSSSGGSNDWPGIVALFTLTPIAIAYARTIWRRGRAPAPAVVPAAMDARFAQLEQAIDTVAVEVERVAEGQRFVTKLLREGQPVPDFAPRRAGDAVTRRAEGDGTR
jgi:hypothetical protein